METFKRMVATVMIVLVGALTLAVPTALAAQQSVVVGDTVVGWTGAWQYDASSSMDQQATLTQVDTTNGTIKLATYGEFRDGTVGNASQALDTFAAAFFDGADATAVVEADTGELTDGTVWKLFTFELEGLELTFLATVSQGEDGAYVVSTLTGNTDQFSATIQQAQAEITLNGGLGFLSGLDAVAATKSITVAGSQPSSDNSGSSASTGASIPSSTNRSSASSNELEILSVTKKDAGIGDGTIYVYVEVANNTSELYSYVGVEGTCRGSSGGILGTGIGNTMNVAPGETVVITMIIMGVPGCSDVEVRFDGLTGMI